MWNDVAAGDCLFSWDGTAYTHSMFINRLKTTTPKDLYYCAHTVWRRDHAALDTMPSWKTSGDQRVICLPDAPRGMLFGAWSGGNRINFRWANKAKWFGPPSAAKTAGKKQLAIVVTFDTDMKVSETPAMKLKLPGTTPVTFGPYTATGYNAHGWYTGSDSEYLKKNRTWRGTITADNMPGEKNVLAKISIYAKASDGTYNDKDRGLDEYTPGEMEYIKIKLDTRTDVGKARD